MSEPIPIEVTPEKITPWLKKADADQLEVLYLLAHHLIRGNAPAVRSVPWKEAIALLEEGTSKQLMLIYQAAYHIVHKS